VRRLVGVFCAIVHIAMWPMFYAGQDRPLGRPVTFQLIDDDDPWNVLADFEELAEECLRRRLVAMALHQSVEDMALLLHSAH
jgi:hypothetical protein